MRFEGNELSLAKECFMKKEGNVRKIFEGATRLDSWNNYDRVEFV
jgi:hypothetical protein